MNDWTNWIANLLPLLFIVILWVVIMIFQGRRWQGRYQKLLEKQNELIEQQLTVLRETNELLKQLRASRG